MNNRLFRSLAIPKNRCVAGDCLRLNKKFSLNFKPLKIFLGFFFFMGNFETKSHFELEKIETFCCEKVEMKHFNFWKFSFN